jgi:hypothetical protein
MSDPAAPPTREAMADYERRAEAAYAAMYDAPSWDEKDLKDDALFYLARALEIAEALGLAEDAARLKKRSDNIMGVYNSQFRYIGR